MNIDSSSSSSTSIDPDVKIAAIETEQCSKRPRFIEFKDGKRCYLTAVKQADDNNFYSDAGIKLLPIDDNNTTYNLISLRQQPIKLPNTNYKVDTSLNRLYLNQLDATLLSGLNTNNADVSNKIKVLNDDKQQYYFNVKPATGWDTLSKAMKDAGNITSKAAQDEIASPGARTNTRFVRTNNRIDNKYMYITKHGCAKPINDLENPANHVDQKILASISYKKNPESPPADIINNIIFDGQKWLPSNQYNGDMMWNLMDYPGAIINGKYTVIPQTGWLTTNKL